MTELQQKILEIFKSIEKICEDNNLSYYAVCGTCIGAVRHNGFIPWDDDLDIGMPYADYKKFYEIAKRELPSNLKVFYTCDLKSNPFLFMKVHDINTTFIEKNEKAYPDDYKGIFVDIFPIYGVPSIENDKRLFLKKLEWTFKFNIIRRLTFDSMTSIKSKVAWIFVHLFPVDFWAKKCESIIGTYHFDESEEVGILTPVIPRKNIYDKSCFESYVHFPFEDTIIRCPGKWDVYLSNCYGDYMKIPPASEQQNHMDEAIVDLEHSYLIYQKQE